MTLKCVIIDDEPLAAQLLRSYAEKIPSLELVGVFSSAIEASKTIRSNRIDLAFLDIQMLELSGLEFAKLLPKETKIIFTPIRDKIAISCMLREIHEFSSHAIRHGQYIKNRKRLFCP